MVGGEWVSGRRIQDGEKEASASVEDSDEDSLPAALPQRAEVSPALEMTLFGAGPLPPVNILNEDAPVEEGEVVIDIITGLPFRPSGAPV
jgi:hypothetical protein